MPSYQSITTYTAPVISQQSLDTRSIQKKKKDVGMGGLLV